ncbi:hypothetical protein AB4Z18_16580 [Leifsonia sp. 2TAF2]|uniref:hypothetical protein n=1 Tax=Leifsonia sp. 2TAF2 TaxID=3233009 RepID=UPI003F9BD646
MQNQQARIRRADLQNASEGATARIPLGRRFLAAAYRRWVPLALVFASLVLGFTVTAHHTQALSPIDEWVYSDYLDKLPGQVFMPRGQEIGPQALEHMACVGVRAYGPMGPKCGSDYSAHLDKFPQAGITSADAYTPLYFVMTWAGAKPIQLVTGVSLLEAARFTGPFWLAGGMLLFSWLLGLMRIRPVIVFGLGLAVIASPFAWWTFTFVSTDAPVLALGAFMLIAAIKYVRGQWSGWWLPLIAAVATLFKITSILAVLLVTLWLVLEFVARRIRERPRRRGFSWREALAGRGVDGYLMIAACSAIAALVVEVGWLAFRAAIAVGPAANQGVTGRMSLKDLGSQFVNFLPGTVISNVNITGQTALGLPIPPFIVEPLSWITIGGVVGAVAIYTWRRANSTLVYSIAALAILGAPLLAIALDVQKTYFPIPPRYGAALLPAFLLSAGLIVRSRLAMILLVAYPAIVYCIILVFSPVFK